MHRLSHRTLQMFSKSVLKLYSLEEPGEINKRMVECVSMLVSGDFISSEILDSRRGFYESHSNVRMPNHDKWVKRNAELVHQHPVVPYVLGGGKQEVLSPCDLVPKREFQRTDLFNEAFRAIGTEQLFTLIPNKGTIMGVVVNRFRAYTESERTLLKLLRPHLVRAYEVAQVSLRAQNAGIALPSPADLYDRGLTDREIDVLKWMREGKSDREIGIILGISHRTVNHHVASILRKLGVETRVAAIIRTFGED
ncbi:hypothetical protein DB346_07290 [Verrucomicrobia bacterium LW23]|nr:hypothetical protein DB346_07290 [Verrucomicrobia bacterium LW23]